MQMILKKRILRDFKENLPRYLALGLMVILGMYIVISLVRRYDCQRECKSGEGTVRGRRPVQPVCADEQRRTEETD